MACKRCKDERWVCEAHPAWTAEHARTCGEPGMPCPACNRDPGPDIEPRLPKGFQCGARSGRTRAARSLRGGPRAFRTRGTFVCVGGLVDARPSSRPQAMGG